MIQLVHNADVSQQAAVWAERQADGLNEAETDLLRQWLQADALHRAAFADAREQWVEVGRMAKALAAAPELQSLPVRAAVALDRPEHTGWRRRAMRRVALVATLVLGCALWLSQPDFSTGIGEIETFALADGSQLTLNAGSSVNIRFTAQERRIELLEGELFVAVAKNPARPFVVETSKGEARAVGTAFGVRVTDEATAVLVTEGLVDVARPAETPTRLSAQQSIRVGSQLGLVTERSADDVRKALAWREQRLFFNNVALAEFVDEMNRYSYRRMIIVDTDLSAVRVGGAFATGDTQAAVTMLEAGFPIKAVRVTPLLTLLYRDADPLN